MNTIDELKALFEKLQADHERMKKLNAYWRRHKCKRESFPGQKCTVEGFPGLSPEEVTEINRRFYLYPYDSYKARMDIIHVGGTIRILEDRRRKRES